MSEGNKGILKKVISVYNDSKIAVIKKMMNNDSGIYDENSFIDNSLINVTIERLKKEYSTLVDDFKITFQYDKTNKDKLSYILNRQKEINLQISFLASNNFDNIDSCLSIIDDIDTDFKICLLALKEYKEGNKQDAFIGFYNYFKDKNSILDHYLINKTYGSLLLEAKQYELAVPLLQKVIDKKPEDIEAHMMLRDIYGVKGQLLEEQIETKIIELLEE